MAHWFLQIEQEIWGWLTGFSRQSRRYGDGSLVSQSWRYGDGSLVSPDRAGDMGMAHWFLQIEQEIWA